MAKTNDVFFFFCLWVLDVNWGWASNTMTWQCNYEVKHAWWSWTCEPPILAHTVDLQPLSSLPFSALRECPPGQTGVVYTQSVCSANQPIADSSCLVWLKRHWAWYEMHGAQVNFAFCSVRWANSLPVAWNNKGNFIRGEQSHRNWKWGKNDAEWKISLGSSFRPPWLYHH